MPTTTADDGDDSNADTDVETYEEAWQKLAVAKRISSFF
jgi:hypothetical protein